MVMGMMMMVVVVMMMMMMMMMMMIVPTRLVIRIRVIITGHGRA